MTDTPHLALPMIAAAQAQKHVTHNEALWALDALVMLSVLDRDHTAPPGAPADGARYLVKATATGGFAGKEDQVAHFRDGAWAFHVPRAGWIAYVADEEIIVVYNGSDWQPLSEGFISLQDVPLFGLATLADSANPISAVLNNALFAARTVADGGDGDLRYKLSKATAADTVSLLFQDNFSGRAEIGLTGDDDLHLKVSSDGATWRESLLIAAATGKVSFPQGVLGLREKLTANRTYYVRADGSDSNDGLANTSGGAFLTIQKALNVAAALDIDNYDVEIRVGSGTFSTALSVTAPWVGSGNVQITGDTTTPTNVVLGSVSVTGGGRLKIKGVQSPTFFAATGGVLAINGKFDIAGGGTAQLWAVSGGTVDCANQTYHISGNASGGFHALANGGNVLADGVTVSGTVNMTWATATRGGRFTGKSSNFGGVSNSGAKYNYSVGGILYLGGTTLPGSGTSGSTSGSGFYA